RGRTRARRQARASPSVADERSSGDGEQLELEQLGAAVLQHAADGLRVVVDPRLVEQDALAEKALVQHPFDDLLTRLFRLRLDRIRIEGDLALLLDDLPRHVVA